MEIYIISGVLAGVLAVIILCLIGNNLIQTTKYSVKCERLKEGVRIVQISDLHGKRFGKNNVKLIEKVIAQKPDIIAVTGDIIHCYNEKNKKAALGIVSALKEIAPVFFVAGNHELRNKGYRFFRKDLMEAGAIVLDDCSIDICGLKLVGLKCSSLKNDRIASVTPEADGVKVLLAHMPQFFEKYASYGYDLVLCGHAHGGQWRIPFAHMGIYSPGQGLFPKYTEGVHKKGKTSMVISRGLGNSHFPLRLFNRPELVVIDLVK